MGINFGSTAVPNYQDASFKLNFPSKRGLTTVFGLGGFSSINILAEEADSSDLFALDYSNTYFNSKVGAVGVTHKQRVGKKSYINFSLAAQGNVNIIDNDTLNLLYENPFRTYVSNSYVGKIVSNVHYNYKFNAKNMFKVGLRNDIMLLNLNDSLYVNALDDFEDLRAFKGQTTLFQPYAQYRLRPNEKVTLNFGLHSSYLALNNEATIEPRFGAAWELTKKDRLSFGYGLHSQVQPIESYFKEVEVNGVNTQPNKDLRMTKSHHFILGYQHRFKHGISLKMETYYQSLYHVPVTVAESSYSLSNFGADFNTATPDYLNNDGTATNYGVELTLEKYLDKGFYFLVTSSLYDSKYKGSNGIEFNTAFNGRFTFNSLIGYEVRFKETKKFKNSLTFDAKFTFNGGKRYTPVLVDESLLAGVEIRDFTQTNTLRYDDFIKLNTRVAFKMVGKNVTMEWAIDATNVTNRRNIFLEEFNAVSGEFEKTYQTGFLPIVQYRLYF